jgi:hypothetical protein
MNKFLLAALLIATSQISGCDDSPKDYSPKFSVSSNIDELTIRNNGTPEVVDRKMEISINGDVLGYRASANAPAVGMAVVVPLQQFVKDDKRFDPVTQAVSKVWIGIDMPKPGPDYSASFEFSR